MHLFFDIGLGVGLALAAGMRPFLPALLAGALAAAGVLGVKFGAHGTYSFLDGDPWLIAMAAALLVSYLAQMRIGSDRLHDGPIAAVLAGIAIGIGALLFAGTLHAHGHVAWPGLLGGALLAIAVAATLRPLLTRVRARLDDASARDALTLYLDVGALIAAIITCVFHPLGYLVLALLAWVAIAGGRRSGSKYAGLRILR